VNFTVDQIRSLMDVQSVPQHSHAQRDGGGGESTWGAAVAAAVPRHATQTSPAMMAVCRTRARVPGGPL